MVYQSMQQDKYGVQSPSETKTQVFCRVRSVSASEFYTAGQQGYKPEYRIAVLAAEYNGEQVVEYRGALYSVVRTYNLNEDYVELTVERQAGNGKPSNNQPNTAGNNT